MSVDRFGKDMVTPNDGNFNERKEFNWTATISLFYRYCHTILTGETYQNFIELIEFIIMGLKY